MARVELRSVRKIYDGGVEVVKRIDLDIADGEFLVLVGPSGCGKSTLLRMIAGLEEITEGEIAIDGKVVNKLHPKDRNVAMVFQSYALYPHMTVFDNMAFALKLAKVDAQEQRRLVEEAARLLQIDHLLDRYPKQLSGGQRQRVAMGRAIVRRPKVFLFDEPLSNLDAALRAQMRIELKALHTKLGSTMIYVTHDQIEAMTLADRIVVLNEGVAQQIGAPLELYRHPANVFVAGFIGSPQMNFIEATASNGKISAEGLNLPYPNLPAEGKITLGLRPPELALASGSDDGHIVASVEVIEPLGDTTLIHAKLGSQSLTVSLPSEEAGKLKPETKIHLHVPQESVHLFDPTTGRRLN